MSLHLRKDLQSTQVIETDLLKVDHDAPVKYRTPTLRNILANFQGREVKKMTVKDRQSVWREELEGEVDRLYTAKAAADSEADAAHLPRSELPAFVVEYYLEQLGTVTAAQDLPFFGPVDGKSRERPRSVKRIQEKIGSKSPGAPVAALRRVRQANIQTGAHDDGKAKFLWMQLVTTSAGGVTRTWSGTVREASCAERMQSQRGTPTKPSHQPCVKSSQMLVQSSIQLLDGCGAVGGRRGSRAHSRSVATEPTPGQLVVVCLSYQMARTAEGTTCRNPQAHAVSTRGCRIAAGGDAARRSAGTDREDHDLNYHNAEAGELTAETTNYQDKEETKETAGETEIHQDKRAEERATMTEPRETQQGVTIKREESPDWTDPTLDAECKTPPDLDFAGEGSNADKSPTWTDPAQDEPWTTPHDLALEDEDEDGGRVKTSSGPLPEKYAQDLYTYRRSLRDYFSWCDNGQSPSRTIFHGVTMASLHREWQIPPKGEDAEEDEVVGDSAGENVALAEDDLAQKVLRTLQSEDEMEEIAVEMHEGFLGLPEKLCSIMACIRTAERTAQLTPPCLKVQLFARFLQFCTSNQALPLPVLDVALRAKRFAHASAGRHKMDSSSAAVHKLASMSPSPRAGRFGHSVQAKNDDSEVHLTIPNAWDSATKALPFGGTVISRRELFAGPSTIWPYLFATFPEDSRHPQADMNDFFFLLLIVHDRLRREAASKMRNLIARVENRGTVTCDEFRDALRDAQILGIDDAIWRSKLCPPAALGTQAALSEALVLEYLGGGSHSKLTKGYITESQMLWATVEAVAAELHDRRLFSPSALLARLAKIADDVRLQRLQEKGLKRFYALDGLFGVDGWLKGAAREVVILCAILFTLVMVPGIGFLLYRDVYTYRLQQAERKDRMSL
eukprot:s1759_g4.t2